MEVSEVQENSIPIPTFTLVNVESAYVMLQCPHCNIKSIILKSDYYRYDTVHCACCEQLLKLR